MKYIFRLIINKSKELSIKEIAEINSEIYPKSYFLNPMNMVFTDLKDSNIMCDSTKKIVSL